MVYLNPVISIDIKEMEKVIMEKINHAIENELDYLNNMEDKIKEKIKSNILKEIKYEMKKDNFIYMIMAKNKCVYKHNRGNNDGYFCHKNITNNGDSKKYVCRMHNKLHKPQKKLVITSIDNIPISKSKSIDNDIDNISISESIKLIDINNIKHKHIHGSLKYTNNIISNNKLINKKYIKNTKINIFKTSLNLYNNIVCKYKNNNTCYNIETYGCCDFKHIYNKIPITNFLYNNNLNIKIDSY